MASTICEGWHTRRIKATFVGVDHQAGGYTWKRVFLRYHLAGMPDPLIVCHSGELNSVHQQDVGGYCLQGRLDSPRLETDVDDEVGAAGVHLIVPNSLAPHINVGKEKSKWPQQ